MGEEGISRTAAPGSAAGEQLVEPCPWYPDLGPRSGCSRRPELSELS